MKIDVSTMTTTTLEADVKPCPFCGCDFALVVHNEISFHQVYCRSCGGKGGHAVEPLDAIKIWNKAWKEGGPQ